MSSARKKRSIVWNHFDEEDGKKGRCNHCAQIISFAAGAVGNLGRHLRTRHPNIPLTLEHRMSDELPTKKTLTVKSESSLVNKKKGQSYFSLLRKYCVDLVQVHNRPLELFDDLAFRNIMLLLPISMDEKLMISSKYIENLIQSEEEWLGEDIDDNFDDDDEDELYIPDDGHEEPQKLNRKDFSETDEEECTCNAEERQKKSHSTDCPALVDQKYWAFFDVSIESAECKVCYKRIKWSSMADLKRHLIENHSELKFTDDDEVFATESQNVDIEEIYIEDKELKSQPKPPTRKRLKHGLNHDKPYISRKDPVKVDLERFDGLDRFGLYVAYLLRALPSRKCVKFQEDIVIKLLREQAMAG